MADLPPRLDVTNGKVFEDMIDANSNFEALWDWSALVGIDGDAQDVLIASIIAGAGLNPDGAFPVDGGRPYGGSSTDTVGYIEAVEAQVESNTESLQAVGENTGTAVSSGDTPKFLNVKLVGSTSIQFVESGPVDDRVMSPEVIASAFDAELGEFDVSNWEAGEEKQFTLPIPATKQNAILVSCREEHPNENITNNDWSIEIDDTDWDLYDSAYAETVTPAATTGETTLTLSSGSWAAEDVGRRVVGNGGEAIITAVASAVADITVLSDFDDTSPITSGNWQMYAGMFKDGSFTLAGFETVDWDAWDGTADGAAAVFESATTSYISSVALDDARVLVAYIDGGNGSFGTARVLTVNPDKSITPGAPDVFHTVAMSSCSVALVDTDKAVVAFGTSNGKSCTLSVSGADVTHGASVIFETGAVAYVSICKSDTDKALVCYQDTGNSSYGTACVLECYGTTTITTGTPWVFYAQPTTYISVAQLDTDKVILCMYTSSVTIGYGYVLSVVGTTISKGGGGAFESNAVSYVSVAALSPTKAVVVYRDDGNSLYGTAAVLDISGTTVTPGTPVAYRTENAQYNILSVLSVNSLFVAYKDGGNSFHGAAQVLTIDGTDITYGAVVVYDATACNYISSAIVDSGHVIVSYQDHGSSDFGTAKVLNAMAATYAVDQFAVAITNSSGEINSEYFTDLNNFTPSDTLNSQSAFYGISMGDTTFEIVGDGETTLRNVVKFDGVWKYNSNVTYGAETWTAASVDDPNVAVAEALTLTQNQMSNATAAAVLDATWPDFQLVFNMFMAVFSDDAAATPTVESISFNYDGTVTYETNWGYSDAHKELDTVTVVSPDPGSTVNVKVRVTRQ